MKISSLTFIIITTASLRLSASFLLNDDCPVPSPCTCSGSSVNSIYIRCNSKNLMNIPHIKQFSNNVKTLNLYFYSNKLTSIPNNAFWNFSSINASNIELMLYSNKIHTIESNAFNGIENVTTSLHLQSNNITAISLAFRHIVNLRSLYIRSNPLQTLDASAMSNIGRTLTHLSLDLNQFTEWPQELHYLRVLRSLIANNIPFPHLDINAFHGFETTLHSLTLDYSKLEKVPYAICHLSHLIGLTFRYGSNLKENKSSIFEPCGRKLSTVTNLDISHNNIHTFPNIYTLFPSVTNVNMNDNKLKYIESTKIPVFSRLRSIYLQNNYLNRIPYAMNRIRNLTAIYIYGNKITIIDTPDLAGLNHLQNLNIHSNPITYIAPDAFIHNVELDVLDLDNTHLDHIPVAVTNITRLSEFRLSGVPIDCSCDMSYLKHWNVSDIRFYRFCALSSSETIKSFIMNSLQSCP